MVPKASPDADAPSARNADHAADAPPVPFAPKTATTAFVLGALRQIETQSGRDCARTELVDALAACCLYSLELDGLAATLKLLADAALILEKGYGGAQAERPATVH
jgi:MoxR-like ATPase